VHRARLDDGTWAAPSGGGHGVAAQLHALADLNSRLYGGGACLIAWQSATDASTIRAATDARSPALLDSLFAAVQRDPRYDALRGAGVLRFSRSEMAAACEPRGHDMACAAVTVVCPADANSTMRATVVLAALRKPFSQNLAAAAELTATAAITIMRADVAKTSRDFWRKRSITSAERLARSLSEAEDVSSERSRIDRAVAAAERLRSRNRFDNLGKLLARIGPFDAWIIATLGEGGMLRVSAASGAPAPAIPLEARRPRLSALTDCFLRQATTVRATEPPHSVVYDEDRAFDRFGSYVCVPFADGAIALAAHTVLDSTTIARVEALMARLNPLIAKWLLAAEADRLRRLVRNLGLRMYGAIDAERARIARDLHDHQAQLLAAARIGIEAGLDEARGIFKQLEDALRLRVRELRPATLGRATLAEGLRDELRRLAEAGITGRLTHADKIKALTRPVQQVCYQVAREALANVMRHAGASRVEIAIEKRGERVRLSIIDNGTGIDSVPGRAGIGLTGLSERLELMGGRVRVESRAGSTRLVAEIPEPA
jgi:signal transduction histidine kinase